MKLTDNQLPAAQTSGDMVTLNMGISDNAEDQLMILNVLSSTLYTDKPAAVLREYACNAFDANVEAGKGDVPIEVCLPNKLEPSLRIRDFGFGMSEEQIANTFVKLGRSTKRSSNAFTGMLGIGSKSGFAYGDSFMVTSFIGGKKVVYNAFRDKGAPRLAKMLGPVDTTEPDGIEIKVPVRMEHFEEFRQKAERIYRYFKVRPVIKGAKVDFQDATRLMSGTGWHYTGSGNSVAIMGNVGYDLRYGPMGMMTQKAGTLIQLGVELEFNIGDLEITASREGLQYKDITKNAVLARIKIMVDEVGRAFTGQIANASCMWEARRLYGELFERLGQSNTRSLKEVVDGHVKWNGQVINTGRVNLENKEQIPGIRVTRVFRNKWAAHKLERDTTGRECYASQHVALVINDLPSGQYSPAREKTFFTDLATADMTDWVVFTFPDAGAQAKYWTARGLDGAPTINLSSVTPAVTPVVPGAAPRVHNSKHSAKAFVLDEPYTPPVAFYSGPQSAYWIQESVNLKKDCGAYVMLDSFYVHGTTYFETSNEFQVKIAKLRAAGLITGKVYGFKRAVIADGKLGSGWVLLKDAISAKLNELIVKSGLLQEAADFVGASEFVAPINPKHAKFFGKSSKVRDLLDKINDMRKPSANKAALDMVLRAADVKPWLVVPALPAPSHDLTVLMRDMHKEYPLLEHIRGLNTLGDPHIKVVADYVAMVDDN